MEKRYSQMTKEELYQQISHLNEKAKKAEQMGMINEFAVYERKRTMAKSYLLDPENFQAGQRYKISDEESFLISYLNGVFAWGYRDGSQELEAVPISLLEEKTYE